MGRKHLSMVRDANSDLPIKKKAEGWAEVVPMVPTQKFMMLRLPQKRTDLFLLQTNRNRNQKDRHQKL